MADKTDEHIRHNRSPLAYENKKFLNGPDGRILRILAEYQEPLSRFRRERIQDTIVFFGSARFHSRSQAEEALQLLDKPGSATPAPEEEQQRFRRARADVEMARYYEDARKLAFLVTQWTKTINQPRHRFVITTGGGPGIMEAANKGAKTAGGKSVGLNILLPHEQDANPFIDRDKLISFDYFFVRKLMFIKYAQGFVVLPGGLGTMDELFEALTLIQTNKIGKFPIVLVDKTYWTGLIQWIKDTAIREGKVSEEDLDLFILVDTADETVKHINEFYTRYLLKPNF